MLEARNVLCKFVKIVLDTIFIKRQYTYKVKNKIQKHYLFTTKLNRKLFCFKAHHCVFIILGPNTLTVIKKGICNKKCTFYSPEDLERIEFTETKERGGSRRGVSYVFCYDLKVVEKNGKEDVIFNKGGPSKLFTSDEIEYFLYTVNTHIQTKMKEQNKKNN